MKSKNSLLILIIIFIFAWGIIIIGRQVVPRITELFFSELPVHPYFVISQAPVLYLITPLVVLSSFLIWLFPGILITLLINKSQRYTEFVIRAFSTGYILYWVATSTVKLIAPKPVQPVYFLLSIGILSLLAWVLIGLRIYYHKEIFWPIQTREDTRRLIWTILIPLIGLLLLFPVIFWQDMHGDGLEALELGRSLSSTILPRFPNQSGVTGLGIGMLPMAYPIHWFISLFGDIEASARLPLLFYLPIIFSLLIELIEWKSNKTMEVIEEGLLVLALGIITVTMGYNASYEPYFADIAAPTALEYLTIICILGCLYFLWREEWFWVIFFGITAYLCRPIGLLFLGLLAAAIFLIMPEKRKRWLPMLFGMMVFCFGLGLFFDNIIMPWLGGTQEIGYQSDSIIHRIRYIRLFEPFRINFALFPSGIIPFISLFLLKWQDRYAKLISIIVLGYFGLFLFLANIALHHFVLVMFLPLVVFWRIYLNHLVWNRNLVLSVVGLAGIISLWLSLPRSFEINRTIRPIGQKIMIEVGDYQHDFREMVQADPIYKELIPPDWLVSDRSQKLITTPLALIYYGSREKSPGTKINYIIRSCSAAPPPGFTRVAQKANAVLYVRDLREWEADRVQQLNIKFMSPLYVIPRGTLFYYWTTPTNTKVFDLMQLGGKVKRFILGIPGQ